MASFRTILDGISALGWGLHRIGVLISEAVKLWVVRAGGGILSIMAIFSVFKGFLAWGAGAFSNVLSGSPQTISGNMLTSDSFILQVLKVGNKLCPLQEAFDIIAWLAAVYVVGFIYRLIKSWIPTVS
jgi:hypothetical protein